MEDHSAPNYLPETFYVFFNENEGVTNQPSTDAKNRLISLQLCARTLPRHIGSELKKRHN